ncbi:MAG: DUF533 domain-containing protein [Gammaproteobacteria bacterium]|nr:DUF533 domain-containing protein [Gammaproteobacteria bacterium]
MASFDAIKILGGLLSSGALSRGSGSNVLGSVIGAVTGGGQAGGGGLGGLVGGMLGGSRGGGGLGDLLGGLLGGAGSPQGGGGLGDLVGMAMNQFGAAQRGEPPRARADIERQLPSGVHYEQAEQQAETLVRAMINAAKSDGRVDADEQQKIVDRLGDVSADDIAFLRRELEAPLDVDGFARSVPRGMEQQVYAMSLMAIDLDSKPEAQYLHRLAQATGISADVANRIHEQLGAPTLYR